MLTVADIMTTEPCVVMVDTPLGEVMKLMQRRQCRQLPVMRGDTLVGIITDRDVRLAMNSPLVLHERADDLALMSQVSAEACMTSDPQTVNADTPAIEAARLLLNHKFGGMPVVDEGKLVGIISVSDVLSAYINLLEAADEP